MELMMMYFAMFAIPFLMAIFAKLSNLESKVARLENKLNQLGAKLGIEAFGAPILSDVVKQILKDQPSQTNWAIKALRDETGCGLAEAKETVEAYIQSQHQQVK